MGRKSLNKHNNRYLQLRQELGLTREEASELLEYISDDRLEKIENNRAFAHPDEVLLMAEKYKNPQLCNYYCSNECPIGKKYVPHLEVTDLKDLTFDMIMSLEKITKDKDRFVEIARDGKVTKDELNDFMEIQSNLDEMSATIHKLKLFIESKILNNEIE